MSFTMCFNKKDYLEWAAKQIEEDEVVVVTAHVSLFEYKKKTETKDVTFNFPAFGFKNEEGINEIMRSKKAGIAICDRSVFKKGVLDLVDGKEDKFIDDAPVKTPKATSSKRAVKK